MRPDTLFRLTLKNRGLTVINEGVFIRERITPEYCHSLYMMDFYYYELSWNIDKKELLYVSFVDENDVDYLFPGIDENDRKNLNLY